MVFKLYGIIAEQDAQRVVRYINNTTRQRYLNTFPLGAQVEILIQEPKTDRSTQQNKYYWAVVLKHISDYTGYEPEEVHDEMKKMFNPVPSKFNPEETFGGSTTRLTTGEFSDYIEKICMWAAVTFQIVIPEANEV